MRINLLPPELLERQRARRMAFVVGAAGVALLLALAAFYVVQQMRLTDVRARLDDQRAENARLQQEIAELQNFDELERELEAGQELEDLLLQNEVLWSGVLRDISLVIPGEAWLSTLTGTITAEVAEAETEEEAEGPTGLIGQISFGGFAFEHPVTAVWLARLEDVEGFVNPWLTSSQKTAIGEVEVVEFQSTVDLSQEAAFPREAEPRGEVAPE